MTVKPVHRGLLITAVAGGLMLASQALAGAAIQPAAIPTPTSIVQAQPALPAPIDSVVGIVVGTIRALLPVGGLPGLPI